MAQLPIPQDDIEETLGVARQQSRFMEQILDRLPLRIYWKDLNSVFMGCNQLFAQDAGLDSPQDVVGKTDYDLPWLRKESDFYRECDQRIMDSGKPQFHIRETQRQAGGREVLLDTGKLPLRDSEGKVNGILGYYEILPDQPRSGKEWTKSQQNFRELVESVNDIIFSVDGEGKISYISPVIEQITGYHPSDVMGHLFAEYIQPEDLAAVQESFQRTLQGQVEPLEYRIRTKDGRLRWARSSSRPITRDGRVVGVRGVIADITQERALEQQMRQAQKMEAVGQLAGGVAHDFNNLLTTILGHCDLMSDSLAEHDPMRPGLKEVRKAALRAASLTQQLLAFSRKQMLSMKVLDLTAVIRDLEKLLVRMAGENIGLRTKLPPALGRIRCDQAQLEQVIIHLVVNAREAMPHGGHLTIEASNVDFPRQQPFRHFVVPAGRYVELSVRDTGAGMDSETLAHIFEPFFTTKEKGQGTGLGLATVYGIVKQSGGYVSAESSPGAGTAFRIYLPRLEEEARSAPADELSERPGGSETLMVVEDDPGVRSLMCRVLRQAGYAVIEARHPGEALLMCEQHDETIDLLVTDVVMPHMSGPELASRLAPQRPDMKVLYVSGYADEALALHGIPDFAFLQKPYKPDVFARKVRELLDS